MYTTTIDNFEALPHPLIATEIVEARISRAECYIALGKPYLLNLYCRTDVSATVRAYKTRYAGYSGCPAEIHGIVYRHAQEGQQSFQVHPEMHQCRPLSLLELERSDLDDWRVERWGCAGSNQLHQMPGTLESRWLLRHTRIAYFSKI